MANIKQKIGFVGLGWIGKHLYLNFKERGYKTVPYSLEKPYVKNKNKIKDCDIVFVAVPTPTTPNGFDDSILSKALKIVGNKKIVVVKSTILPGTLLKLQEKYPKIYLMHSPEFLVESTVVYNTTNPERNIIGIPIDNREYRKKAKIVMSTLPYAPYSIICNSEESALIKYGGNCFLFMKIVFMNILYDLVKSSTHISDYSWDIVKDAISADSRIGRSHIDPVHKTGRGGGGDCFIKDMEAFYSMYKGIIGDENGIKVLKSTIDKNLQYLIESNKDLDIIEGVYGKLTK